MGLRLTIPFLSYFTTLFMSHRDSDLQRFSLALEHNTSQSCPERRSSLGDWAEASPRLPANLSRLPPSQGFGSPRTGQWNKQTASATGYNTNLVEAKATSQHAPTPRNKQLTQPFRAYPDHLSKDNSHSQITTDRPNRLATARSRLAQQINQ